MIGVVSFHTKMDLAQNGGILLSLGALELPHPTCQPLSSKQFRPGSPGDRGDLKVDPRFCGPKIPGNGATLAWFFVDYFLLAVGLSRIARGEVVSFCVPAVFWWLLYTFIIFGNSSCIIFAVVRSTLLLLHFHLHSLFFRSYLVSLKYFDDFCSYAALVHVSFLLLCAVLCCFWAFICILCAFVISLCAHSILMIFFISSNNSCNIFALCVVLCWFCPCVCACCFFRIYLVSLPYFDGFYHIRQ